MTDKKPIQVYLEPELKEKFDKIASLLSINKSKFLRNQVKDFVQKNEYLIKEREVN